MNSWEFPRPKKRMTDSIPIDKTGLICHFNSWEMCQRLNDEEEDEKDHHPSKIALRHWMMNEGIDWINWSNSKKQKCVLESQAEGPCGVRCWTHLPQTLCSTQKTLAAVGTEASIEKAAMFCLRGVSLRGCQSFSLSVFHKLARSEQMPSVSCAVCFSLQRSHFPFVCWVEKWWALSKSGVSLLSRQSTNQDWQEGSEKKGTFHWG